VLRESIGTAFLLLFSHYGL